MKNLPKSIPLFCAVVRCFNPCKEKSARAKCDVHQRKVDYKNRKEGRYMRINVNQTQCGFVMKNGCYEKMIFAGTYHYPACMGYKVIIEEMRGRVGFKEVPL